MIQIPIGKNAKDGYAIINDNFSHLLQYKWYKHSRGYVVSRNGGLLHHAVVGKAPKGMVVDHIDRDRLNNRLENLRFVSFGKNSKNHKDNYNNTSGHRGVIGVPSGKWVAYIWHEWKKIHLGTFETFDLAVSARLEAEEKYGYV